MAYKLGLKLWSINTNNYLKEAVKLYNQGVYDYIELYVVPNSLEQLEEWKKLKSNPFKGMAQNAGGAIPLLWRGAEGGVVRNTKNYKRLPYNPALKQKAKELRKAGNLSEVLFWNEIKNKKFKGLDFDRQKIIGNYIVDFYCASQNLVIEIDGESHAEKKEYDLKRENFLKSFNLQIIHIYDSDIKKNLSGVMEFLNNHPAFGTPPREGNHSAFGIPAGDGNSPTLTNSPPLEEWHEVTEWSEDCLSKKGNHSTLTNSPPLEGWHEVPGWSKEHPSDESGLNIPFIIHCPHFAHGFNLAKKEKQETNKKIFKEVQQYADTLNAEYIVIHGGIDGDIEETARQLASFNEPRALIENKPFIALPNRMGGEFCRGYNTNEIKTVQEISGCGFCLDFGHAICAANSLKQEPYSYIENFLKLKPQMFHLTDVSDMTSPYDAHPHLGEGQLDIKRILKYIPNNKHITLETIKNNKENIDDFISDTMFIRELENENPNFNR